jgi:hypothetical protein
MGDFSDTRDSAGRLMTIYDPATVRTDPATGNLVRDAFPGNIILANRFDPVAKYALQFYPEPNLPGNQFTRLNNYFNSGASPGSMEFGCHSASRARSSTSPNSGSKAQWTQ